MVENYPDFTIGKIEQFIECPGFYCTLHFQNANEDCSYIDTMVCPNFCSEGTAKQKYPFVNKFSL